MAFYQLKKSQKIPASIDEVWAFVSSPANLREITPDYLDFKFTSDNVNDPMYPGMMISYKVSPLLGIKMTWVTEITVVKEKEFFIDEQRVGPYKMWHHQHFLEKIPGGVIMHDIVSYIPPLGPLGAIANGLFIKGQLEGIFDYRFKAVERIFGKYEMKATSNV